MKHIFREFSYRYEDSRLCFKEGGPEKVIDFESDVKDQLHTLKNTLEATGNRRDQVKARQKYYQGLREAASGKNSDSDSQGEAKKTLKDLREKFNAGQKAEKTEAKPSDTSAKTEVQAAPGVTPPTTPEEPEEKDISLTTILPYEELTAVGTNEEPPTATPTDRSTPLVEVGATADRPFIMPDMDKIGGGFLNSMADLTPDIGRGRYDFDEDGNTPEGPETAISTPPATPTEASNSQAAAETSAGADEGGEVTEEVNSTVDLDSETKRARLEWQQFEKDMAAAGPRNPRKAAVKNDGKPEVKRTTDRITERMNIDTHNRLVAEEEQAKIDEKKAALEYTQREAEKKAAEDAYKKTVAELTAQQAEIDAKNAEALSQANVPTSSPAPHEPLPLSQERMDENKDLMARLDAETERRRAELNAKNEERLQAEEAAREERIVNKFGKPLAAAIDTNNQAEIKRIVVELNKHPERISDLTQALSILNKEQTGKLIKEIKWDKARKSEVLNDVKLGPIRRLARQQYRVLDRGVDPQEDLPEVVYPSTKALQEAIAKGDPSQISKIEAGLNDHRGLRGGGEIKKDTEITKRKQKVVDELSRQELEYIVSNTNDSSNKEASLKYLAQQRLDTMPKTAE